MSKRIRPAWALCCAALVSLPGPGPAAGAREPEPAEIVRRSMDHLVFRSEGAEMKMTMTLRNKRGETRQRTLFARAKREGGLARTLVRFLSPSDVAGTAFLFVEHRGQEDDQYMYLPALKVTRRIAGKQKNVRFMGSDFTYRDLEWQDLDQASYRRLPDERVGKDACYVIDSFPSKKDAYTRLRSWIRIKDSVLLRLQFFDLRSELLKVLFVKEVRRVSGSLMATRIKMSNEKDGHSTFLEIHDIRLRADLSGDDFTVRALKQ